MAGGNESPAFDGGPGRLVQAPKSARLFDLDAHRQALGADGDAQNDVPLLAQAARRRRIERMRIAQIVGVETSADHRCNRRRCRRRCRFHSWRRRLRRGGDRSRRRRRRGRREQRRRDSFCRRRQNRCRLRPSGFSCRFGSLRRSGRHWRLHVFCRGRDPDRLGNPRRRAKFQHANAQCRQGRCRRLPADHAKSDKQPGQVYAQHDDDEHSQTPGGRPPFWRQFKVRGRGMRRARDVAQAGRLSA